MTDQTKTTSTNAVLCGWCGTPLGSANTQRETVCVRCYRLLLNAGLTDAEIFVNKSTDEFDLHQ